MEYYAYDVRDNFFDYTISAQSRFSKPQRRLQQFAGWVFTYSVHQSEISSNNPASGKKLYYMYGGLGFSHYIKYNPINRLAISLRTTIQGTAGDSPLTANTTMLRIQVLTGLAYRI